MKFVLCFVFISFLVVMPAGLLNEQCEFSECSLDCQNKSLIRPFAKERSRVHTLKINNCEIQAISDNDFREFTSLDTLVITNSKLTEVASTAFNALYKLTLIIINGTELNVLHEGEFKNNSKLSTLRLSHNGIQSIGDNLFPSGLEELDLSFNMIDNISISAFKDLSSLQTLMLNGNRLTELSSETIFPSGLKKLLLSSNNITELQPGILRNCTSLEELSLSSNNILHLSNETFLGLEDLRILRLDHNKISKIETGSFIPLHYLKYLWLQNNFFKLQTIMHIDMPKSLAQLHVDSSVMRFSFVENDFSELTNALRLHVRVSEFLDIVISLSEKKCEGKVCKQTVMNVANESEILKCSQESCFLKIPNLFEYISIEHSNTQGDNNTIACQCINREIPEFYLGLIVTILIIVTLILVIQIAQCIAIFKKTHLNRNEAIAQRQDMDSVYIEGLSSINSHNDHNYSVNQNSREPQRQYSYPSSYKDRNSIQSTVDDNTFIDSRDQEESEIKKISKWAAVNDQRLDQISSKAHVTHRLSNQGISPSSYGVSAFESISDDNKESPIHRSLDNTLQNKKNTGETRERISSSIRQLPTLMQPKKSEDSMFKTPAEEPVPMKVSSESITSANVPKASQGSPSPTATNPYRSDTTVSHSKPNSVTAALQSKGGVSSPSTEQQIHTQRSSQDKQNARRAASFSGGSPHTSARVSPRTSVSVTDLKAAADREDSRQAVQTASGAKWTVPTLSPSASKARSPGATRGVDAKESTPAPLPTRDGDGNASDDSDSIPLLSVGERRKMWERRSLR